MFTGTGVLLKPRHSLLPRSYSPSSLPLTLACDASSYGLGAILSHRVPNGEEQPIAYASCTLIPSERNYSQLKKEGLACIFGTMTTCSVVHLSLLLTTPLLQADRATSQQASSLLSSSGVPKHQGACKCRCLEPLPDQPARTQQENLSPS